MKKVLYIVVLIVARLTIAQEVSDSIQLVEMVSTPTGINQSVKSTTHSVIKISQEELQQVQGISVIELLSQKAGIYISNYQTNDTENVSLKMRGGTDKNVLVLIDGIPANDHSQPIAILYDLRNLDISQVASIEVLKGGASVLYGTNASSGVINIKLKKTARKKISGNFDVSVASWDTYEQKIDFNGTLDKFSYNLMLGNAKSNGFSSAKDLNNSGFDKDGYEKQNMLVKLGYDINSRNTIQIQSSYNHFLYDYDAGAFLDSKNRGGNERIGVNLLYTNKHQKGELSIIGQFSKNDRQFESLKVDNFTPDFTSKSGSWFGEIKEQYTFLNHFKAIGGVQFQQNEMDSYGTNFITGQYEKQIDKEQAEVTVIDPYLNIMAEYNHFYLNTGIRFNIHDEYGTHLTYSISPAYVFELSNPDHYFKIRGDVSSAYITPTLYQLYSAYGNTDLKPEETTTFEGGITYDLDEKIQFNATCFYRTEKEIIQFYTDPNTFKSFYTNGESDTHAQGVELNIQLQLLEKVTLNTNYIFTERKRESEVLRIPKHKVDLFLHYNPFKNTSLNLAYSYVGDHSDAYFDSTTYETIQVTNDAYHLFNWYVNQKMFKERLTLYGGINNLLNETLNDVIGYNTKDRNYKLGVRYQF